MISNQKGPNNIVIGIILVVIVLGAVFVITQTQKLPFNQVITLIAALIAAVFSIWNTFSVYQNSIRLEELKQKMNLRFPALQETTNAAVQYYYSLARIESGNFELAKILQSEEAMEQVTSKIYFLEESYQTAWYRYWQKARYIAESINPENAESISPENLALVRDNWRRGWSKDLSNLLNSLLVFQEKL
jgi:hypothetical protein